MTPNGTRVLPALPLLLLFLVSSCGRLQGLAGHPRVLEIDRDTEWSGTVRVEGIVHVRKGAVLSIRPGTRVLFADRRFGTADEHEGFAAPGIRVDGSVVAEGTGESPILFTSAREPAAPGSWDKILFSFSAGSRFRHCTFEGARYALHAHFSQIEVGECLFRDNVEGVRLGASRVTIADSVFTRNEVRGINFRECRNEIRGNLVFGNGDGIFLHSKNSASVIRGNAVYGNRGHNLRLGDLHAEDIDVSGNWWGSGREEEARKTVYDGRNLGGIGNARISPVLARSPVSGGEIRGIFVSGMHPVSGGEVRAYRSVERGFWGEDHAASAVTGPEGLFRLPVPPGRWFVVGRADSPSGTLFAFPGRNPVPVPLRGSAEVGLPSVDLPPAASVSATSASRPSIVATATEEGMPVGGAAVSAYRPDAPDFRGPGEATAVTDSEGRATLFLPPGRYVLAAKKRMTGAPLGMVEEGGRFGVYPHSPVDLAAGTSVAVTIPLFEKLGLLSGEEPGGVEDRPREEVHRGSAGLGGRPARGHVVYFYRPPETIGRPLARSSEAEDDGAFTVPLPGPGDYLAFLRRAIPGLPAGTEEERIGPVRVRAEGGRILPSPIPFRE